MPATILFFSANPSDTSRLDLDEEYRSIAAEMRRAHLREDAFDLRPVLAARIDDVRHELADHLPAVVHFCGHGRGTDGGELVLKGDDGRAAPVPIEALAELFRLEGRQVRCVVLSACHTLAQAEAIVKHVDSAIGTTRAISNRAAIAFAKGFYGKVFGGGSVEEAFDAGRNGVALARAGDPEVIVLRCRAGVRPDQVRFAPGGMEARFVVPFLRHHGFVGREEDLERIDALLKKGEAVGVQPVAAVGMGGIGKTQIAVEYAYRHAADYPGGVYWVNAAADVQAELARLADDIGIREEGAESERRRRLAIAFGREIGGREDALVIFDNVEDPRSLANDALGFVPAQMKCRVLFTTRRREDARGKFAMVPVGALPDDEALALLGKDAEREWGRDEQAARDVCRIVGCLPLALALAGAFLRDNPEVKIGAYRDRLKREGALTIDAEEPGDDLPTRHDKAVEATLRVSWEATKRLPGGGESERLVMTAAALLGEAAEVPRARLALLTGLGDEAVDHGYPAKLAAALRRLVALSLVEDLGEKGIRLHPLVREFAERRIEAREAFAAECAGRLGEGLWDMSRLGEAVVERGIDAVLEDLRAGARIGGDEAAAWLGRLSRVLDREAHCLRRWQRAAAPELLLQQVRNRCFELGEDEGSARAEQALAEAGKGWLRERARVSRESETLVRTLEGHAFSVNGVSVTPDGRYAVSASDDATLKVWDLRSGQLVRTLEGHTRSVKGVSVTPDGRYAVSASDDATLKVWDLGSGQLVRTLEGHENRVAGVSVTPDGRYAVSASHDATLKVWDLGSGQLVRTLEGHTRSVNGVSVTPDGRYAVSASDDTTLEVWDLVSGQLVRALEGHENHVTSVSVTPNGRCAVSASSDRTLKVWDLLSGQLVRVLEGNRGGVTGVTLTPDGDTPSPPLMTGHSRCGTSGAGSSFAPSKGIPTR